MSKTAASAELPYYVRALVLALPAILFGLQIPAWFGFVRIIADGHGDFRQLYAAGGMVRTGLARELYDYAAQKRFQDANISPEHIALPFNHLAYEALLFAPFSMFQYQRAYCLFLVCNLLLLWLSYRCLKPYLRNLLRVWKWLPAAIFIGFIPVGAALMQGQDSIVLLLLFACALVLLERGNELAAGGMIGLGLFKFQIVVPIAMLLFAWRRWRFFTGFAFSAAAGIGSSLLIVGFGQMKVFAESLLSMSIKLSPAGQFIYGIRPDYMPNLRGLVFGIASGYLSSSMLQLLIIVTSIVLLAAIAKLMLSQEHSSFDLLILAIPVSVLVSYHFLIHDMTILLVPIAMALNRFLEAEVTGDKPAQLTARTAAVLFCAPALMSFLPQFFYLVTLPLCAFLFFLVCVVRSRANLSENH